MDPSTFGLLARALCYFKRGDSRLAPWRQHITARASQGEVFSLWAIVEDPQKGDEKTIEEGAKRLHEEMLVGDWRYGVFPSFDPRDLLLGLRVIALAGKIREERWEARLEQVWAHQKEGARWHLEECLVQPLAPSLWRGDAADKWGTLSALRVLSKT
jgi:hypothetical protein